MSPRGFVNRCSGELNGAIDELVERLSEQRALVLDDADDGVRDAADAQLASERIQVRKEVLRDFVADHGDGEPSSYSCGEITRPEVRSYFLIVKYSPSTAWVSTCLRARVRARTHERLSGSRSPTARPAAARRERSDVGVIEARPTLPLEPLRARRVVAEPRISSKRERVGAEQAAGEIVLHVSAHALDDRHDGDEEHHADHDARAA